MHAKRSRELEATAQPFHQSMSDPSAKNGGLEAMPTLTNYGGGHREGKVLPNARLNSHQNVQRAVCIYFLENKCRKGADCHFSHDAVVPHHKEMCIFHFAGKCNSGRNCIYSHDGKQQPCKFLFGRGKCDHGSSCRFSHDPPSAEALAMVQEQWKSGGVKVERDTIESCELKAFDSFMSLDRHNFSSGMWGLNAWEGFNKFPSRTVVLSSLNDDTSPPDGGVISAQLQSHSQATISINSNVSIVTSSDSVGAATPSYLAVVEQPSLDQHPVEQNLSEPSLEQGDGSEFWS